MFCADFQQLPVGYGMDPLDRLWSLLVVSACFGGKLVKYHDHKQGL